MLEAVLRDLGVLPAGLRTSGRAATAVRLAAVLDKGSDHPAPVARELRECLRELEALAGRVPADTDLVDELRARRRRSS